MTGHVSDGWVVVEVELVVGVDLGGQLQAVFQRLELQTLWAGVAPLRVSPALALACSCMLFTATVCLRNRAAGIDRTKETDSGKGFWTAYPCS